MLIQMRKLNNLKNWIPVLLLIGISTISCTKLDVKTYSAIPATGYFKNAAEIAAAKAPAYSAVSNIFVNGSTWLCAEVSSDEMIFPTRGTDWQDGGTWASLYYHIQTPTDQYGWIGGSYNDNLNGASQCNFIIYTESNLATPPSTLAADVAEMTCLRSYFYYNALDLFGNIPYVTNFKVDPSTVQTIPRSQVFDSIERDLKSAIPLLPTNVDASTYGKATKWLAYSILARMYLNAGVYKAKGPYPANDYWQHCIDACDSVIAGGGYSLDPEYFNSFFGQNNLATPENIFVMPASGAGIIPGNGIVQRTLEFNSALTFGIPCCNYGNNGASATADFYQFYDTNSVYTHGFKSLAGRKVYSRLRTFNDHRTAQWLIGQQFQGDGAANYPPWNNWPVDNDDYCCTYNGDTSTKNTSKIGDFYNSKKSPVLYYDKMLTFSAPSTDSSFRHAGVRNVKYWPQAGNATGNQGNAIVVFRLADIILMKAEAERNLGLLPQALADFNQVRERAYGGTPGVGDWTLANMTDANVLAERGRELAWEMVRRTDQIRFGTYTAAHNYPPKPADADDHFNLYPIPTNQINSNPNLKQNPGY